MAATCGSPRTQLSAPLGNAVNHVIPLLVYSASKAGIIFGPSRAVSTEVGNAPSSEVILDGGWRRPRREEILAEIDEILVEY